MLRKMFLSPSQMVKYLIEKGLTNDGKILQNFVPNKQYYFAKLLFQLVTHSNIYQLFQLKTTSHFHVKKCSTMLIWPQLTLAISSPKKIQRKNVSVTQRIKTPNQLLVQSEWYFNMCLKFE